MTFEMRVISASRLGRGAGPAQPATESDMGSLSSLPQIELAQGQDHAPPAVDATEAALAAAIIDTTPECIKVVARDGRLLRMNAAGLAMVVPMFIPARWRTRPATGTEDFAEPEPEPYLAEPPTTQLTPIRVTTLAPVAAAPWHDASPPDVP